MGIDHCNGIFCIVSPCINLSCWTLHAFFVQSKLSGFLSNLRLMKQKWLKRWNISLRMLKLTCHQSLYGQNMKHNRTRCSDHRTTKTFLSTSEERLSFSEKLISSKSKLKTTFIHGKTAPVGQE
ncbi:hypothetical protein FHG87_018212 [Trinorchestia longiramus]|nr:hypothetical protein FHG87_018212 [Trinorchestia longiramus]